MSLSQFEILSKLGEGSFSKVFKARRISDNQLYAIKKASYLPLKSKEKENALNEVRILASLNSPNIIEYKEAFFDESGNLCIVMEFASSGDILNKINNHRRRGSSFSEDEIWDALVQITKGLKVLHDLKILHRDLKSANIFIGSNREYKLGDLNVSKINKHGMVRTQTGTPYYASPEVWKDKPYNASSDIWSLGCVIYEMAALHPPFTASDMNGLYRKITRGVYPRIPRRYSSDLARVISSLLQVNPRARPTCEQLLQMVGLMRHINVEESSHDTELIRTIRVLPNIKTHQFPAARYPDSLPNSDKITKKALKEPVSSRMSPLSNPFLRIPLSDKTDLANRSIHEIEKSIQKVELCSPRQENRMNKIGAMVLAEHSRPAEGKKCSKPHRLGK